MRLRDAFPDLLDRLFRPEPLPPASLRRHVALTSSRADFLAIGRRVAADLLLAFDGARDDGRAYPRWLDFGCGPGRVARHLLPHAAAFTGIDVDAPAIAWAGRHLPGRWLVIAPDPPVPLPDASFDVVTSVSVFTHLDEARQLAWLRELRRLLAPGGLLLASTHSERLLYTRPDVPEAEREALRERGFLFARGAGPFNEDGAFHTEAYLRETWGALVRPVSYRLHGLAGYQDLSVWQAA